MEDRRLGDRPGSGEPTGETNREHVHRCIRCERIVERCTLPECKSPTFAGYCRACGREFEFKRDPRTPPRVDTLSMGTLIDSVSRARRRLDRPVADRGSRVRVSTTPVPSSSVARDVAAAVGCVVWVGRGIAGALPVCLVWRPKRRASRANKIPTYPPTLRLTDGGGVAPLCWFHPSPRCLLF